MGGIGSGRYGGRPTTADGLTLDLAKLMRDGLVSPNAHRSGSLVWTETYSGRKVASLGYAAWIHDHEGELRLRYTTTSWDGEKHPVDMTVRLLPTPQPFGGQRWWFVCPHRHRRCAKLHLPPGALTFASRQAYGLAYRSQRQTRSDRALDQAFKRRRRLGDHEGGIGDDVPKPKGMHWATFDREMERIDAAEAVCNAHLVKFLQKRKR